MKTKNGAKGQRGSVKDEAGKANAAIRGSGSGQGEAGLLDMSEAIEMLKTSRPTFFRWVRAGKIKGAKVGRQWRFTRQELDRFLKGQEPVLELQADIQPLIRALDERLKQCGVAGDLKSTPGADDVVRAVSGMMRLTLAMKASDLHVMPTLSRETGEATVEIRCRVDGHLQTLVEMDPRLLAPVVERWKRMANCNIRESRLPQDGRVCVKIDGKDCDLRVSFLPLTLGESVTVRLLSRSAVNLDLDRIDYTASVKEKLLKALHAPWGIVVVTGPVGCGKTTTLYACINRLASADIKITAIENPVEYSLPGVAQMPIRPDLGLTYASALRAVLRSASNVIMVGELRDAETVEMVHQCALTGHRVLTALHTNDAASALTRMLDIGSTGFLVGDTVKLVVAQRLIRKLCPECSQPEMPSGLMLERAQEIISRGGLDWKALPKTFRKAVGCKKCNQTGYRGRTVIAEALEMTPELARALTRNALADELTAVAVRQGMIPFAADGIRRAAEGETSVEEIIRVAPER